MRLLLYIYNLTKHQGIVLFNQIYVHILTINIIYETTYLRFFTLCKLPMKLTVRSNFFKLSNPSRFSITSMLLRAKFKYSNLLSILRFSIFDIRLFCNKRILRCRQCLSISWILSIFSWCKAISSNVDISPSLCSERFRINSRVIFTIFIFCWFRTLTRIINTRRKFASTSQEETRKHTLTGKVL